MTLVELANRLPTPFAVRVALRGKPGGPGLGDILSLPGREE